MADPVSDLRNALICKGGATKINFDEVTFKGVGCYVWEDADAILTSCNFDGGMHGVYAWGRCQVQIDGCYITGMEKSGVCIREGVSLSMQVRAIGGMIPALPPFSAGSESLVPAIGTAHVDAVGYFSERLHH